MHDALVDLQQLDRHERDALCDFEHPFVELVDRECRVAQPSSAASIPEIESPVNIISIALRMPRNHG
jgi:hypothetical protein